MGDDSLDLCESLRHPTPGRGAAPGKTAVSRAYEVRRRNDRQTAKAVHAIMCGARLLFEALHKAWRRHLARRKRIRELLELSTMDDNVLNDIGVSRPEIHAALHSNTKYRSPSWPARTIHDA